MPDEDAACYTRSMSLTNGDLTSIKQVMQGLLEQQTVELDKKFDEINQRLDVHDKKFDEINRRLDVHDEKFDEINRRLDAHDKEFALIGKKFQDIDKKFTVIDQKFMSIDQRFDDLKIYIDRRFDESTEVQNEILNAIGTDINRHSARIDDHEDRIAALEVKAT